MAVGGADGHRRGKREQEEEHMSKHLINERDGTTEPVSREHILRRERGQGKSIPPVQLIMGRVHDCSWLIPNVLNVMSNNPRSLSFFWHRFPVLPTRAYVFKDQA